MQWTVGIDEVGRGPLAGPVAVGVFAVPVDFDLKQLDGIKDSKKISEKKRNEWSDKLQKMTGVKYAVAYADAEYIDTQGIVPAVENALAKALLSISVEPLETQVLLDGGLRAPSVYRNQKTIIRGDVTEPVISAAAILAKVTRDAEMCVFATKYSEYGFDGHKGYGTKKHREAISAHGLCPIHRKTFCTRFKQPVQK